jgi:hypothetical protein
MDWMSILNGLGGMGGLTAETPPMPDFADRFGDASAAGVPPAPPMPASPISPESLAASAAARGIPPPPVDLAPPLRMPPPGATDAWRAGVDADMGGGPGSVGAALTGKTVGAPLDLTSQAQKTDLAAPTDMSSQSKPKSAMDKFSEGLKGVKAPAGPELQRLSTPSVPRPTTQIKGGELMALLQMLGPQAGGTDYKLPSTLGAALRK